jgi:hypothetical protein
MQSHGNASQRGGKTLARDCIELPSKGNVLQRDCGRLHSHGKAQAIEGAAMQKIGRDLP